MLFASRLNLRPFSTSFRRAGVALLCGVSLALGASCTKKEEGTEIVIGFNPAENADTVEANGKTLARILKEKTGVSLKTFVASDYGALVEAMRSGKVHFGFLAPFSLVQAEKIAGAKVLLKAVRKGHAHFFGAIITNGPYKSIDELKGKTIAWTDPTSASGHILAKNALMDRGIDPDTFFAKQIFAGGHDALVMSVLNKTVDAGATFANDEAGTEGSWTQLIKGADAERAKNLKVLLVTKPIPGDTLATTQAFYEKNKALVDQVTQIMMDLSQTEEGKKVLKDLYRIDAMVPAKSEDYEYVRQSAARLKI